MMYKVVFEDAHGSVAYTARTREDAERILHKYSKYYQGHVARILTEEEYREWEQARYGTYELAEEIKRREIRRRERLRRLRKEKKITEEKIKRELEEIERSKSQLSNLLAQYHIYAPVEERVKHPHPEVVTRTGQIEARIGETKENIAHRKEEVHKLIKRLEELSSKIGERQDFSWIDRRLKEIEALREKYYVRGYGVVDLNSLLVPAKEPKSSAEAQEKSSFKSCLLYTSPSPRDRG